jgi:putative copper export protein
MHFALELLAQQSPGPSFTGLYWVQFVSRICHILGAIILVGGLFYLRTVISPVDTPPGTARVDQFFGGRRATWAKWVGIVTALLLISGLFNYTMVIKQNEHLAPSYHMVAGIKMLCAIIVFLLAALLAGRTSAADALRQKWKFWLSTTLALGILTTALGSFLRTYPRTPKPDTTAPQLIAPANPTNQ